MIAILFSIPMLTIGCAKQKPHARLIAPPECIRVTSSVELTPDGKSILPKSHFDLQILCSKVVSPLQDSHPK